MVVYLLPSLVVPRASTFRRRESTSSFLLGQGEGSCLAMQQRREDLKYNYSFLSLPTGLPIFGVPHAKLINSFN